MGNHIFPSRCLLLPWVFLEMVKQALLSWSGSFVGKKRKDLEVSSYLHFFDSLEGEKPYSFYGMGS